MPRNEDINNGIWDDPDFDALSANAKLVYLWSFTNPRCGMSGLYRVLRRDIAAASLSGDDLEDALKELEAARFLYYHENTIWVRSRVKHLRTKGEPMKKSILADLAQFDPEHPLVQRFCEEYRSSWIGPVVREFLEGFDGGSEGVPKNGSTEPMSGTPGEPLEGSQGKGKLPTERRKRKNPDVNHPPSEFPETLVPIAERCVELLGRVAEAKGSKPVTLLAVCRAIENYPNREFVKVAGDLEHWCLHGNGARKPARDIVARWRNFLDTSPEVAQPNGSAPARFAEYDATVENAR